MYVCETIIKSLLLHIHFTLTREASKKVKQEREKDNRNLK